MMDPDRPSVQTPDYAGTSPKRMRQHWTFFFAGRFWISSGRGSHRSSPRTFPGVKPWTRSLRLHINTSRSDPVRFRVNREALLHSSDRLTAGVDQLTVGLLIFWYFDPGGGCQGDRERLSCSIWKDKLYDSPPWYSCDSHPLGRMLGGP